MVFRGKKENIKMMLHKVSQDCSEAGMEEEVIYKISLTHTVWHCTRVLAECGIYVLVNLIFDGQEDPLNFRVAISAHRKWGDDTCNLLHKIIRKGFLTQ